MSATFSRSAVPALPRRSYTSVGSFGLALFTYDYSMDSQTMVEQGVLTPVGTSADCPPGRILYENGKKLVPAQGNFPPILVNSIGGLRPLTSYMVGVFDPQSGLSGFIDPNSVDFAINNTDKPVFLNNNAGVGPTTFIPNSGNPVVTRGNILSLFNYVPQEIPLPNYVGVAAPGVDFLGFLNAGGNEGIFAGPYALAISEGDNGSVLTGLACGEGGNPGTTNWAGMYGDGNVYFTGNLYTKNTVGTVTLSGGTSGPITVQVGNAGARVFLTYHNFALSAGGSGLGLLTYTLSGNTLTINSTNNHDVSTVNWLIVNGGVGY